MRSPLSAINGYLRLFSLALVLTCTAFYNAAHAQVDSAQQPEPDTFTLFDSRTDAPIPGFDPIPENATLNLNELPRFINIRANLKDEAGSIKFSFRNKDKFQIENAAPFALFGDVSGDYNDGHIPIGSYTLTATPYAKKKGRGATGEAFSVSFKVVRQGEPLEITSFILVDAATNQDLFEIENLTKLDLSALPPHLNIRAEVQGHSKSLKWVLTPKQRRHEVLTHIENAQPYALFSDQEGDYVNGALIPGEYLLSATAFKHQHAKGSKGIPHSIRFNIVDGAKTKTDVLQAKNNPRMINKGQNQQHESGLEPAYPNPFNPTTTIRFSLSEPTHARLVIYDLLGRQVKTLLDGYRDAGSHEVVFEAGDLPSGAYLYRLTTPNYSTVRQFTLSK